MLQELGIPSVNFVPEYSSEGCRLFAVIALGESHTPDVSFFASIHESKKQRQQANQESSAYLVEQPDYCMTTVNDIDMCDESDEIEMLSSEKENAEINGADELSLGLQAVFDVMRERLKERDPNYVTGVAKFLKSYRSMQEKTISTPSIASALHTFGMEGQ